MASGEGEKFVNDAVDLQALRLEESFDVVGRLTDREGRELERFGLTIERPLILREQSAHQRWLASGKYIGGGFAVMLDHRTKEAVESIVGHQQVLELIEADDGEFTICFEQDTRDIEQLEEGSASLVSSYPRRLRCDGEANSGGRRYHSQAGCPATNAATRLARQVAIRMSNTDRHIPDGRHLGEIDSHSTVAGFPHRHGMSFEQAALAKPTRGGETNSDAIGSRLLKCVQLGAPIDEMRWRDRTLVFEWVHRTQCTTSPDINVRETRTLG